MAEIQCQAASGSMPGPNELASSWVQLAGRHRWRTVRLNGASWRERRQIGDLPGAQVDCHDPCVATGHATMAPYRISTKSNQ